MSSSRRLRGLITMVDKIDYERELFSTFMQKAEDLGLKFKGKKLLTIGERTPDFKIIEASKHGWQIDILEAFPHNLQYICRNPYIGHEIFAKTNFHLIQGDIIDTLKNEDNEQLDYSKFDLVWWFHGIEHLTKQEGEKVLRELIKRSKVIIMSMPHGVFEQSPEDLSGQNNPYELHKSAWYPIDFEGLKAVTFVEGAPDMRSSMDVFIKGDLYEE